MEAAFRGPLNAPHVSEDHYMPIFAGTNVLQVSILHIQAHKISHVQPVFRRAKTASAAPSVHPVSQATSFIRPLASWYVHQAFTLILQL